MQQPDANGLFDIGFGVDIAISSGGQKKRKPKKKKPQAKPLKKSYQSFAWTKGATALSAMNPSTQQLIADIFAGNAGATPFFNHGYDKDPETRGSISGTAFVSIYYQPASANEDTISNQGLLSGRRRLAVKIVKCSYPDETEVYAFYTTNHPQKKPGLPDNSYGIFTPVDMSR